jgi:hypothetical protein
MTVTFYTITIGALIGGTELSDGHVDNTTPEAYGALGTFPSTDALSLQKTRANLRYNEIISRLGENIQPLQISNIIATGASADTPATSFEFTVAYDRIEYLRTEDELNPGIFLEGAAAVDRWVERALTTDILPSVRQVYLPDNIVGSALRRVNAHKPEAAVNISNVSVSEKRLIVPIFVILPLDVNKDEGNSGLTDYTFTVNRWTDIDAANDVDYTVTGSGSNPANAADFVGGVFPAGTLNFVADEASKIITVQVIGDTDIEPNEEFTITLSNPTNNAIISALFVTGPIYNDEPSTLSIAAIDAVKAEGNSGTTPYTFDVTRGGTIDWAVTVDWAVTGSGGNPADSADFVGGVLPSGSLTFIANDTVETITVNVIGDVDIEVTEEFTVTLSNQSANAAITGATAIGSIQDDDNVGDAIDQLLATMADWEAVKLNSGLLDSSRVSTLMPRTQANFDYGVANSLPFTTFANDSAVSTTIKSDQWAFSGSGVNTDDALIMLCAGGHTDSGDSSVYEFDAIVAAQSILDAGPGGVWTLGMRGATYKLEADGAPLWNPQSVVGMGYVAWESSVDFIEMPPAAHSYAGLVYTKDGNFEISGNYTFRNANGGRNAAWRYNSRLKTMVQATILPADDIPARIGTGFSTGNSGGGIAYNSVDDNLYVGGSTQEFGTHFCYKWDENGSNEWASNYVGGVSNTYVFNAETRGLIIEDPANPGEKMLWQHYQDDLAALMQWQGYTHIETSLYFPDTGPQNTATIEHADYAGAGTVPFQGGTRSRGYCTNAAKDKIFVWGGADKIHTITPVADYNNWGITENTITGDIPPGGGNIYSGFDKLTGKDALLGCSAPGNVWLIKIPAA